jgi:signal transduction histidine kinase
LLQNAIQAQRENSVVAQVAFNLSLVDGSIQLELVDQGMGISQERQEHLFEINFTTRSEGLGLGLAMSRKIVEQHGGSLHLCYSDDRGTSFMWTMPVYDLNSDCSDS